MNERRTWLRRSGSMGTIGLASAIALTGCTPLRVTLGMSVHLDKLPVTAIAATLPKGPAIAPGESSPMVVTFIDANGKVWVTEGTGKGKILWSDLAVTASVVRLGKNGMLSLPHDPRKTEGKTGRVDISVPGHPDLRASLDIPLRYDYAFVANFNGADGRSGFDGTNGTDGAPGSPGSPGSCVPDNSSGGGGGGNGGDGTDGGNGSNGGNGGNAPPVKAMITLRSGDHPLLQAVVSAPGRKDRHFLVDPQGGSLSILANGGAGGSGGRRGKGGRGGTGGSGGFGCPSGSSGRSGSNGRDGMSGSDGFAGRGGPITIVYDPAVRPYLAAIKTSNKGAPAPMFQEAAVAPLW